MKAVVTLSIKDASQLGEVTHPLMKAYADKVGADFIILDKPKLNLNYIHFEKYQIYDLLDKYERILFLDTDIIINPICPNLFDIVPPDQFGAFIVSKHSFFHDGAIKDIQAKLGNINWERVYFNSGVMVVSQCHRKIYEYERNQDILVWASGKRAFYEQSLLNYNVQKMGIPIYDIGYQFNHTTDPKNPKIKFGRRITQLIDFGNDLLASISPKYKQRLEQRRKNEVYIICNPEQRRIKHRLQSYIIHYTGKGHRECGSKLEQIKKDLSIIQHKPFILTMSSLPLIKNFIE